MLDQEIVRRIKQLEIKTKRLLHGQIMGANRSARKGSGFDFDQIREYSNGDDIRSIDWNSSARMNTLLVREYKEERNRTFLLLIDVSASSFYGSTSSLKYEFFANLAAVLSLVAQYSNDSVSVLFFSDHVEKYIPANKGVRHIQYIMNALYSYQPQSKKTNIAVALEYIMQIKRKDMMIFLLSDCIDTGYEKQLKYIARAYDLTVFQALDACEQTVPSVGFLTIQDIETEQTIVVDIRKKQQQAISSYLQARLEKQKEVFRTCGIKHALFKHDEQYIKTLIQFF